MAKKRKDSPKKNKPTSKAKFYDLREIPFEPTGAASSKYSYVPPEEFSIIEDKIKEVVSEKKLYMLLLKAPQGGGKTSMAVELRKRITSGHYVGQKKAAFVYNKLIDLDISNYVKDLIREASQFLTDRSRYKVKKEMTPTDLKNLVVDILKALGQQNELVAWVIDEFDILVGHPKSEQTKFLQFVRDIVDDLADESLPIMFLMSHTWRSSKEFEDHLREIHRPFQSRIAESLEIGYTYDEVRKIVAIRLNSVSLNKREKSSILPFTEEALKELYESIVVSLGGTEDLTDFRFFERCCYYSLLRGAQNKIKEITPEIVREVFTAQIGSEPIGKQQEDISAHTKAEIVTIMRGPLIQRLESTFDGLSKGLELSHEFSAIDLSMTDYVGEVKPNTHIGSWQFSGKHTQGRLFRTLWFIAYKTDGIIVKEEMAVINDKILEFLSEPGQSQPNLSIFTYVSDVEVDSSDIKTCDEILRINRSTMRELIGLGVSVTERDIATLKKSFDADILPDLREIYAVRVRDITKKVNDSVIRAILALHIYHLNNEKLTRASLKQKETFISGRRILPDRWIKEMEVLGFASGTTTSGYVPETPKSIKIMLDCLEKNDTLKIDEVNSLFGDSAEYVLDLCWKIGIIEYDYNRVKKKYVADIKESVKDDIDEAKNLVKISSESVAKNTLAKIVTAIEKSKQEGDEFSQYVALYVGKKKISELNRTIREGMKIEKVQPTETVTSEPIAETREAVEVSEGELGGEEEPQLHVEETTLQPAANLEDYILEVLSDQPLTYLELRSKLISAGFEKDITPVLLRLIITNKIKITL